MAVDRHEITDSNYDFLNLLSQLTGRGEDECLTGLDIGVYLLEDGDGERGSLSGTGLGLSNNVGSWRTKSISIRGK